MFPVECTDNIIDIKSLDLSKYLGNKVVSIQPWHAVFEGVLVGVSVSVKASSEDCNSYNKRNVTVDALILRGKNVVSIPIQFVMGYDRYSLFLKGIFMGTESLVINKDDFSEVTPVVYRYLYENYIEDCIVTNKITLPLYKDICSDKDIQNSLYAFDINFILTKKTSGFSFDFAYASQTDLAYAVEFMRLNRSTGGFYNSELIELCQTMFNNSSDINLADLVICDNGADYVSFSGGFLEYGFLL